jgi:hypothetical protein
MRVNPRLLTRLSAPKLRSPRRDDEVKELGTEQRQTVRQQQTRPILDALHEWMTLQRMRPANPSCA